MNIENNLAQTVVHSVTKETVTFLETAAQTQGKHLLLQVQLPPKGEGPPLHTHDEFVESFECVSGKLTLIYGDQKLIKTLLPGDTFSVPINEKHTFANHHDEPLIFKVKLTPPSHFEESMRIHYGLMDDGLCNKKGQPKSLAHTALILTLQNTRIAGIPIALQRWLFNLIVKRALKKGTYKPLEKYIGKSIESLHFDFL